MIKYIIKLIRAIVSEKPITYSSEPTGLGAVYDLQRDVKVVFCITKSTLKALRMPQDG